MPGFLDLAEAGGVPRNTLASPGDAHSSQVDTLVPIRPVEDRFDVVHYAPLQRPVGKQERMGTKVTAWADRRGQIGMDGDHAVSGREGLHGGSGVVRKFGQPMFPVALKKDGNPLEAADADGVARAPGFRILWVDPE